MGASGGGHGNSVVVHLARHHEITDLFHRIPSAPAGSVVDEAGVDPGHPALEGLSGRAGGLGQA